MTRISGKKVPEFSQEEASTEFFVTLSNSVLNRILRFLRNFYLSNEQFKSTLKSGGYILEKSLNRTSEYFRHYTEGV